MGWNPPLLLAFVHSIDGTRTSALGCFYYFVFTIRLFLLSPFPASLLQNGLENKTAAGDRMQANHTLSPQMLANEDRFSDPFFKRFTLRYREQPLRLSAEIERRYQFPTFYGDVTCAQAIFLCDYQKAQAMMPHPAIHPLRMPKGRAVVALACYIYRNVMNVGPYNEIAMTIPVRIDPLINVPVLPLLTPWFKDFGYYVFNMPVTSLENCIRGNALWGLPKVVHDIDIDIQQSSCETRACDEDGHEYLRLRVPTTGTPQRFNTQAHIYSRLGQQFLQSETYFDGMFNVNKHMSVLLKKNQPVSSPVLTLGQGKYAEQLRQLDIEPLPLQTRFAERMNACFDLHNPDFKPPFQFNTTMHTGVSHG